MSSNRPFQLRTLKIFTRRNIDCTRPVAIAQLMFWNVLFQVPKLCFSNSNGHINQFLFASSHQIWNKNSPIPVNAYPHTERLLEKHFSWSEDSWGLEKAGIIAYCYFFIFSMFFCSSLQAVLQWWSSSYTVMTVAARQGSTIWGMTTLFDGRHWCFMSMKQILMTFPPLTFWSLNAHTVSESVWKSKKVGFWSESRKGRPQGDSVGRRQREERDSQQSHTLGGLISNCTCVGLPLNSIGKVFEARANVSVPIPEFQ